MTNDLIQWVAIGVLFTIIAFQYLHISVANFNHLESIRFCINLMMEIMYIKEDLGDLDWQVRANYYDYLEHLYKLRHLTSEDNEGKYHPVGPNWTPEMELEIIKFGKEITREGKQRGLLD